MSRRNYKVRDSHIQPTLLMDVRLNGDTVFDYVSNQPYEWGTKTDNEYFTNGAKINRKYNLWSDQQSAYRSVYLNKKTLWAESNPNPPTNGLCPNVLNNKVRFEICAYYEHDYYKELVTTLSHNNKNYRGFCLYCDSHGKTKFADCRLNYIAVSNLSDINYADTKEHPMVVQWDFTEDEFMCKVYDDKMHLKYTSGILGNLDQSGTNRQLGIMVGNWNSAQQCNPTAYYKYIRYYDGNTCDDFMS